jgi:CRISPR-associated protein Cmr3
MKIKINLIDTVFFRDGKPFGNSDDNWANSFNFPSLNTIYGALRSSYFSQNNLDTKIANTSEDPTINLKINGVYLINDLTNNILFPIPQDIYINKKDKNNRLYLFELAKNLNTSNRLDYIFKSQNQHKDIEKKDGFINKMDIKDYVNLNNNSFNFIPFEDFIESEPKIGIGIDNKTNNVEEGKLYRIDLKRYKNLSILVDFEGIKLRNEGLLRIGGEGKGAFYQQLNTLKLIDDYEIKEKYFKIYFLTPAIFQNGWYPDFLDNNLEGYLNGFKVKLIASSVGKPKYIGGWDIKENRPKSMFKAIPEGSVFFFDILDGEFEKKEIVVDKYYDKIGYGKYIICRSQL